MPSFYIINGIENKQGIINKINCIINETLGKIIKHYNILMEKEKNYVDVLSRGQFRDPHMKLLYCIHFPVFLKSQYEEK